jgi:hypothetical protein
MDGKGRQLGDSAKVLDLVHDPRCRRGPMNIAYLDPPYSRYFH